MPSTYLEVHEVQQLINFRSKNFDSFLINLNTIRLLVRFWLRNRTRTASPSVKHHCMLLAFIEQNILQRKTEDDVMMRNDSCSTCEASRSD